MVSVKIFIKSIVISQANAFAHTEIGTVAKLSQWKSAIHLFLQKNGSAYVRDVCSLD